MMPQSTVLSEPTTCARAGTTSSLTWSDMPIRLYGVSSSVVNRKKLLSVLLSSKMPLVIQQLSVLNRDMISSWSAYKTYVETSLLARRPWPSSCVELGGTPTLVFKRQLTLWTFTILKWKYSMFVCSSLYRYGRYDLIYFICYLLYDLYILQSMMWFIKCKCQFVAFLNFIIIRKSWMGEYQ
jgi:hypothetical protein